MTGSQRLGILGGLVLACLLAVNLVPAVDDGTRPPALARVPFTLDGWEGTEGAPDTLLPADPNEAAGIRRTYRRDGQTAWVAVTYFTRQDVPARRSSVNHLFPQRHTVRIDSTTLPVALAGSPAAAPALPVAIVQLDQQQRLVVAHWRQIGPAVYEGEYSYRLGLIGSTLFARRADALLLRIAVPVAPGGDVATALASVTQVAPPLYRGVREALGR